MAHVSFYMCNHDYPHVIRLTQNGQSLEHFSNKAGLKRVLLHDPKWSHFILFSLISI